MILDVVRINTYYGRSHILFDVSLRLQSQEVVALLGRNGAGKTTTFRSIMGLTPPRDGHIFYEGSEISGKPPHLVAKMGIGWVPEDRRVFPSLTVLENLQVAKKQAPKGWDASREWDYEAIFEVFPVLERLASRKAGRLSGGEQQMLSIARTLMGNPKLLLLDEPTEGLAPLVVRSIGGVIMKLKQERVTMLLSEQNAKFSLGISDRVYIVDEGRVVYEGTTTELKQAPGVMKRFLAV